MSPPRDTADEPEAQPEAPQPKAKAKAKAKAKKPKLDPAPGSAEEWRAIARKAKNPKAIAAAFKRGDVEGVMYLLATLGGSYVPRRGQDQPPQVINVERAGHIKALAKIAGASEPALSRQIDERHQTYIKATLPPPPPPPPPPSDDDIAAEEQMAAAAVAQGGALADALGAFNKRFCVAKLGGKLRIIDLPRGETTEPLRLLLKDTFIEFYANKRVEVTDDEGKTKSVPVAPIWLRAFKARNSCEGIIFNPSTATGMIEQNSEIVYNMWRGFAVAGNRGDWSLLRRHLFEIVCRGNPLWFAYTMSWIAGIVQDPCTKPEAGIAVKGKKGTGKTKVAEWIAALMPNNSITTAKVGQVTGHFNAHHAGKLLLVSEESFWAGDKQGEAAMKHLITGKRSLVEPKGIDAYEVDDFIRLWTCSNSEWVFPATEDERRLFMLECSDARREDHAYFAAIDEQMCGGRPRKDKERQLWTGLQAFMWDLQRIRQPAWVQLRKPPRTPWLSEQIEQSLPALEAWWLGVLTTGRMTTFKGDDDWTWPEEPKKAEPAKEEPEGSVKPEQAAPNRYEEATRYPTTEQVRKSIEQFLKITPHVSKGGITAKSTGRFMAKVGCRRERDKGGDRGYRYEMPTIADARALFTKLYKVEFDDTAGVTAVLESVGLADLHAAELEAWRRYGRGETHDLPGGAVAAAASWEQEEVASREEDIRDQSGTEESQ